MSILYMDSLFDNCDYLLDDVQNYAIKKDIYLEAIEKNEYIDSIDKYKLLKKHFTENLTRSFYQKMKLLELISDDKLRGKEYADIYDKIEKSLAAQIMLAVETLKKEKNTRKSSDKHSIIKKYINSSSKY